MILNHTPADIIRYLLIGFGHGARPSDPDLGSQTPIFVDEEPNLPDTIVLVSNTAGLLQGRMQPSGESVEHYGFQVLYRGTDSQEGYKLLKAIEVTLLEEVNWTTITIGSDAYVVKSITKRSGILPLGRDQANADRILFSLNCTAVIGE